MKFAVYINVNKTGHVCMNDKLLNNDELFEFQKLVQNAKNIEKNADCYAQLMKELIIRSYCAN